MTYGGVLKRFGAWILDVLIISPIIVSSLWGAESSRLFQLYQFIPLNLFLFFYYVSLVQRFGGTPGKRLLKLAVTRLNGDRVGYREATLRFLPWWLMNASISVGFIVATLRLSDVQYFSPERTRYYIAAVPDFFLPAILIGNLWFLGELVVMLTNKKRRTIHDFIAGTVVIKDTEKGTPDGDSGGAKRARSFLLAGIGSLLAPGLGHLYVGRAKRFMIVAGSFLFGLLVLGQVGALSSFIGIVACAALFLGLVVFSIIDSSLLAYRIGTFEPRWYCRWYVYAVWLPLLMVLFIAGLLVRSSLLGFMFYRSASVAMAPVIEPREVVLVDTKAFRETQPKIGDIVVVTVPDLHRTYIRRITDRPSELAISLAADNPTGDDKDGDLQGIPLANILGRVTYLLYSPTSRRIGQAVQ